MWIVSLSVFLILLLESTDAVEKELAESER
jgi:hypothetical protein